MSTAWDFILNAQLAVSVSDSSVSSSTTTMRNAPSLPSAASSNAHHDPSSLAQNRSSHVHAPLFVGLLCFVIQFWKDLRQQRRADDRRCHHPNDGGASSFPSSVVVAWKKRLFGSVPFTKAWILQVLVWIEQSSKSLRQRLADVDAGVLDHRGPERTSKGIIMSPPRPLVMAETYSPSARGSFGVRRELFLAPNCSPILSQGERRTGPRAMNYEPPTGACNASKRQSGEEDDCSADVGGTSESSTESPSSDENAQCEVRTAPELISVPETQKEPPRLPANAASDDWDLIQRVLLYWFGQGRPEQSQRQLWMIAAQSAAKRAAADAAIAEAFGELLGDLAHNRGNRWTEWTGCSWMDPDRRLGEDDTLRSETSVDLSSQETNRYDRYGYQGKIAAIVVLDQFSRHILRHRQSNPKPDELQSAGACGVLGPLPPQSVFDSLAFRTSQALLRRHVSELSSGMIPTPMYVFALMPLRHANTIRSTERVQQEILKIEDLVRDSDAMVRRFRTATNRRMALLQDEMRRVGHARDPDSPSESDAAKEYADEELLECAAFSADLAPSQNHPVHQCICAFLAARGIHPSAASPTPVVVSLSGGVDSMVIVSVLSFLAKSCEYRLKIMAVHIDYGNRPESAAEADYVRRFCASLGNVEFRCRRIDEVTRGVTARDEYEKISRTVRYEMYRMAIERALAELEPSGALCRADIGVFLGHHRGDLRENVLSNAHRGCGPLDLSGMTAVSRNDGVTLYRPLLPLEKAAIFDYAHRYGVPYFKDTTPHWSTRGKLRNKLLPLLEEIYGEGSMNNLSNLALESDSCRSLVHEIAFRPFLREVQSFAMGISIATHPWKHYDLFFWKIVLRDVFHSVGLGMFSEKSIVAFLERVRAPVIREGWLQCRKDYAVYLRRDGRVFVLFPQTFSWGKSNDYAERPASVDVDRPIQVGPWQVSATVQHAESPPERAALLSRKAVPDMESFLGGRIEYYVEARTFHVGDTVEKCASFRPRPLVFAPFTKASRPPAWKSADVKLQEKLPLLCCDELTALALKDPHGCGAVHKDDSGVVHENPIVLIKVTLQVIAASTDSPGSALAKLL